MVWTGNLHECGGVLQGWHISARYGLQGWVYPAGALGARLNHELVRMRGFDGHHGWWEGEPRTGVRGCVGPALRPAASMRHTRALPCPARLSARSAAARAFQPEICPLRPGHRGIAAPGRLVKALFPVCLQEFGRQSGLTRSRKGKRTGQWSAVSGVRRRSRRRVFDEIAGVAENARQAEVV
jgi:hypothetical protein